MSSDRNFEDIYEIKSDEYTETQYQEWFKSKNNPILKEFGDNPDLKEVLSEIEKELLIRGQYEKSDPIANCVKFEIISRGLDDCKSYQDTNIQKLINDAQILIDQHQKSVLPATDFDDIVEQYSPLIGLYGESYKGAINLHFYSLIANQIKLNVFYYDSKRLDIRINPLCFLDSGHGKKRFSLFIRRTIEGLGKQYQEPTSYHPEQFVGKIVNSGTDKDPLYTPIYGTLASDFLVIDEANILLSHKDHQESLRYLRMALDQIGDNQISKKQVNVPDDDKLSYTPTCAVSLYTQPMQSLNDELLYRGTLRRFIPVFINVPKNERKEARHKGKFLPSKDELVINNKLWQYWINCNKKLLEYTDIIYSGNEEDFILIDDYIDKLDNNNPIAAKFTKSIEFDIKYNIFRFAIVRSVIKAKDRYVNINRDDIKCAINDWSKIWIPLIEYVCQNMQVSQTIDDDGKFVIQQLKDGQLPQTEIVNRYIKADFNIGKNPTTVKSKIQKIIKKMKNMMYVKELPQIITKNARMLSLTESGKQIEI